MDILYFSTPTTAIRAFSETALYYAGLNLTDQRYTALHYAIDN